MLTLNNITVIFNESTSLEKKVLSSLSLEVEEGDFICILGSNGAGKSTLFNSIIGAVPYYGDIILNEENLSKVKKNKRMKSIGIVYQDPLKGTAPHLSVYENILLATKEKTFLKRGFIKSLKEKIIKDLKTFDLGLENNLNTACEHLSGGMRQALSLYMATYSNPKLLLLDEHTAALDPKTQDIIMNITSSLISERKITTLMITHNLKTALTYGNRLIILNNGKVAFDVKGKEKENLTEEKLLKGYSSSLSDETIFSAF